jgi:hypothetical protein
MVVGDISSWVAVAVSIVLAWAAKHQSKAAKTSAAKAEDHAAQALAASQSMADSLRAIAHAFTRSASAGPSRGEVAQDLAAPAWNVEYRTGNRYALRNVGTATASAVTVDAGPTIARSLPDRQGVSLEPGQAHEFQLFGAWGSPVPVNVEVTCAELGTRQVPVPAKP